ncbi:MAG: DNRLRE domain-containing protein [Ruminiclostridium sp.]|nr:DNRLRE domain-containing protein [Ruminiclostridium sp.]
MLLCKSTFLRKILSVLVIFSLICTLSILQGNIQPVYGAVQATYYVSPTGSDSNPGTVSQPFKTMQKARDVVRTVNSNMTGDIVVYLRGGYYNLQGPVDFGSADSGTNGYKVIYQNYSGETPHISGGVNLNPSDFTQVTDPAILNRVPVGTRSNLYQINLNSYGITDFGSIQQYGTGNFVNHGMPELFFNDNAMILSRYPNDPSTVNTGTVVDAGSVPANGDPEPWRGAQFHYTGTRPGNWSAAVNDIWVYGYWYHDWASSSMQIQSIDTGNTLITTVQPHWYGVAANRPYYYFNLLEEIDAAGEWYLERTTGASNKGMLYFWPPSSLSGSSIQLSLFAGDIIRITDSSNINFVGLTLEAVRDNAINMYNVSNILVKDCRIKNTGINGVLIQYGINTGVTGSDMYNIGWTGIAANGGSRYALYPSGNYFTNNHIRKYSRIYKSNTYGIYISYGGIGNRIANNIIHDSTGLGIQFNGNDNIVEYNEIYDVNKNNVDVGAIYSGRNWTYRGNVIRRNYIHDVVGNSGGYGVNAIYLDDNMSTADITDNIIDNVERGALINGGRDILLSNNIFNNCSIRTVQMPTFSGGGDLEASLNEVPYTLSHWAVKYPALKYIMYDDRYLPKYAKIQSNAQTNYAALMSLSSETQTYGTITNNSSGAEVAYMDLANKDFRLTPDSTAVTSKGFNNNIDYRNIGTDSTFIYSDQSEPLNRVFIWSGNENVKRTIAPGGTAQLSVMGRTTTGYVKDLSGASISYGTDNSSVATVNSSGLVTGVAAGTSLITATIIIGGVTKYAKFYISVAAGGPTQTPTPTPTPIPNKALGKGYTKSITPNPSYPDDGNSDSTDGIIASNSLYEAKSYGYPIAAGGNVSLDVVVDLYGATNVDTVKVHKWEGSGSYSPDTVTVYTSTDGVNYTNRGSSSIPSGIWYNITFASTSARWVKVNFYKYSASASWLMVDEIQVFGPGSGPTPSPVPTTPPPTLTPTPTPTPTPSPSPTPGSGLITVTAGEDAWVKQNAPTTNYNDIYLEVFKSANADRYSYMKFNVTGITGKTINSVKLRLTESTSAGQGDTQFYVKYSTSNTWSESTLTWNNKPTYQSTQYGSYTGGMLTNGQVLEIPLASSFLNGDGTYTLVLESTSSPTNDSVFASTESAQTGPQLVIETSPITVTASEDAWVKQNTPTTNYNDIYLEVFKSANADRYSYMKFNVTGISGKTIDSVKLKLTESTSAGQGDTQFYVKYSTNNTWSESTLTWNNKPSYQSTQYGSYTGGMLTNGQVLEIPLASSFLNGDGTYTLVLESISSPTNDSVFASTESAQTGPQLVIAYH